MATRTTTPTTGTTITTTSTTMTTTIGTTTEAVYRLLAWLSPSYPTGAFSYSHGIEYAVEAELVRDRASLVAWIDHILRHGAGWADAVLFARAYEAATAADDAALDDIADYAAALRATSETALETTQQGAAFLAVTRAAWPDERLDRLAARRAGAPVTLPIALAVAAAGRVEQRPALVGLLHGFAAALVSAGVRLVPLGQTDGQRATADLAATVLAVADAALACPLERLGMAAPMVDWTSMKHETQYTRLFRS
jgi:urease accessory protein